MNDLRIPILIASTIGIALVIMAVIVYLNYKEEITDEPRTDCRTG